MKYYQDSDGVIFIYEADGSQDDLIGDKTPLTQEQAHAILEQRRQAEFDALSYAQKRQAEYPTIGDQLDALFHAGVFPPDMAARIQDVKAKYPKP